MRREKWFFSARLVERRKLRTWRASISVKIEEKNWKIFFCCRLAEMICKWMEGILAKLSWSSSTWWLGDGKFCKLNYFQLKQNRLSGLWLHPAARTKEKAFSRSECPLLSVQCETISFYTNFIYECSIAKSLSWSFHLMEFYGFLCWWFWWSSSCGAKFHRLSCNGHVLSRKK